METRIHEGGTQVSQRIAIGADHGAVDLKDALVAYLRTQGHTVNDLGTHGHTLLLDHDARRERT